MKRITLFALFVALTLGHLMAQAPKGFNYQAVVRNNMGQIIKNQNVNVRLEIRQGSATGTAVYSYNGMVQTNANGAITILVGENSTEYAAINWAYGPFFLSCEIDPTGGNNFYLSTVQQIMSVPYAEYAAVADSVSSTFSVTEKDPVFHNWNYEYDSLRNAPTKLSDFNNDLNLSEFNNDLNIHFSGDTLFVGDKYVVLPYNNITSIDWSNVTNHPDSLSQFINNLNLSDFNNDLNLSNFYNDLNLSDFYNDMTISYSGDTLYFGNNYVVLPINNITSIDWSNVTNHPDSLSQFINNLSLSDFTNDINISFSGDTLYFGDSSIVINASATTIDWSNITNRPDSLSQFINNLSLADFTNDMGFITGETQNLSDVLANGNSTGGLTITGIPVPVNDNDAVNKIYIDSTANAIAAQMIATLNSAIDSLNQVIDSLSALLIPQTVNLDSIFNLVDSLTHPQVQGSHSGLFSVSATKKVQFSHGNLQYNPKLQLFRFATEQYTSSGALNDNISSDANVWLDLFAYGTSGWSGGRQYYQPYENNPNNSKYMFNESTGDDLEGLYINADWGVYNRIINGGNQPGLWRTLSYDEWNYLLNTRPNASSLKIYATVIAKQGLIIMPDNSTTTLTSNYNNTEWQILENEGAIFLPSAGYRISATTDQNNTEGNYWTSSHFDATRAYSLKFDNTGVNLSNWDNCSKGCSVRLVRDY